MLAGGNYPDALSLYFDSGKSVIASDDAESLDKMATWAKSEADAKVAISAYHDTSGNPTANADLAKKRAQAARDVLVAAGVPADRIVLVKPQEAAAGTGDDRSARRVEIYPTR